jgi:DNA-binding LacI/PurR family transcriptional regulator
MAKRLAELRIPVVCFNSRIKTEWVSSVSSDNRSAGIAAAELLARSGEVFAFVDGVAESPSAHARRGGFQQGLQRLGKAPPRIVASDYSYESGQAAAAALFSGATRPDSVFCVNDHVAFGLIDGLRRRGLRCPEDVRVIGYDGVTLGGWDAYSLTTFDTNLDAMIDLTLKLTLGETEEGRKGVLRTIPPLLIERGSTGAGA